MNSAKILNGAISSVDLANGSITSPKIADGAVTAPKLADGSVTNVKLARYAIPVATASGVTEISTTSTAWADMTGASVTLTLNRTGHLLIFFSAQAMNDDPSERVLVQAMGHNRRLSRIRLPDPHRGGKQPS